jgi:outer membrane protein OmpA-like peptidoglycan-associated protein
MKKILFISSLLFAFIGAFCQVELDTINTFEMQKMSKNVNSTYHEGGPVISSDGNKLYFFRTNHPENKFGDKETQDIWYSAKDSKGTWSLAQNVGTVLNRYQSNQVFAILDNGNSLLISGGNKKNAVGLSLCTKTGNEWANPIELKIPDFEKMSKGKYYGATMNPDKSVIIFYFSEIEGSLNSDLYISTKVDEFSYTKPEKLNLSTPSDDLSPFICEDNKTLYYSSGRKGGMGQVDIYEVKRLDDTWKNWSEPKNMGKPLNSNGFDAYFSTESSFKNAYTTRAHMSNDGGSLEIWNFIKRPNISLSGHIFDYKTKHPIETPFIIEIVKKGTLDEFSDINGFYQSKVMDRGLLIYEIHVDGYETIVDTLDLTKAKDEEKIVKDFYLKLHPKPVHLSGVIYNKKTNETIGKAKIEVEDKNNQKQHTHSHNELGDYALQLPDIGKYKIIVQKEGFYTVTETFEVPDGEEPIEFKYDVYLSPKERPIVLIGAIYNSKTGDKVAGKINYTSPSGQKGIINTNTSGDYETKLPEPGLYKLYTAVEGFMANTDTVTVYVPFSDKRFEKDIELDPIEVGASVRLNEIYFDFNKATLRPESFPELKRVIEFMEFNKTVSVELSGHTDNRGSDEYNQDLSQRRAESVVKYLIDNGVDATRLEAKGYGEAKPSIENDTDENRQFNRRVEFTILKI